MEMVPYVLLIFVVVANVTCVEAFFRTDASDGGVGGNAVKLSFAVMLATLHQSQALIQLALGDLLPAIRQCLTDHTDQTTTLWQDGHNVGMTEEKIHMRCMEKFMWKADPIRWSDYNVTEDNIAWFNTLIMPLIQSLRKDRAPDDLFSPSGFRRRREYRRMSDDERSAFHKAANVLKRSGRWDTIAKIHSGYTITQAHCGPNFYSWHRIYLIIMEEALRQIDRRVAIPYWDSSLDSELDNPFDSIIWTTPFFGNGDGYVTSGSFAYWPVGNATLLRNVGRQQIFLFTKENIQLTMSRCKMEEISVPFGSDTYNLDYYHNGGHFFTGGHMANLETAPYDPIFFMHHSFVDYLLEQFRIKQTQCNVNPETDYPNVTGIHGPNWPMSGFPQILNIDGFQNHWTRYWYGYEQAPSCSRSTPDCGSPYLRCNIDKERCVSKARLITAEGPTGKLKTAPPSSFKELAAANAIRANKEQDAIMDFVPIPPEGLSCGKFVTKRKFLFRRSVRVKTSAKIPIGTSLSSRPFKSPASNESTSDILGVSDISAAITVDPEMNLSFPFSPPGPLLPSVGGPVTSTSWRSHSQWQDGNTFAMYTNSLHIKEMVYISAKVIHLPASITKQPSTAHAHGSHGAQLRRTCKKNATGSIYVSVHAQGLNYVGSNRNKVIVDSSFRESSATTYIAVKKPEMGTSEVLLSAFDECGNVCQPECISDGSNPVEYRPCTGVLSVTSQDPAMYTETVPDAVHAGSRRSMSDETGNEEDIRIIFRCFVF